jgi:hypothetical protein
MKAARILVRTLLMMVLVSSSLSAREFISSEGQKIEAEIILVSSDDLVSLKRADGVPFSVPLDRFSEADQKHILEWKEANKDTVPAHLKDAMPRMVIRVSTGKTNKSDEQLSGYLDEHKQKVRIGVVLENKDAVYPIANAKLTMMVFGTSPESKADAVVYREEISSIDLPLNIEKTFEGKAFELWYDDKGAMYGHKFKGYAVFLEDPQGKILAEVTIPGPAANYLAEIKSLKVGDVFDGKYKKTSSARLDQSVKGLNP